MKLASIIILFILFTKNITPVVSNNNEIRERDRRAELDIRYTKNLGITPDEKIWFAVNDGQLCYTESIDSNWHFHNFKIDDYHKNHFPSQDLDRISFFNGKNAIITGYLSTKRKDG